MCKQLDILVRVWFSIYLSVYKPVKKDVNVRPVGVELRYGPTRNAVINMFMTRNGFFCYF